MLTVRKAAENSRGMGWGEENVFKYLKRNGESEGHGKVVPVVRSCRLACSEVLSV